MRNKSISEHMIKFPYYVEPEKTVREAFYLMEEWRIRHLPVVNGGKLIGVVSDRDLRSHFGSSGDLTIRDVMTATPYSVFSNTPLKEVLSVMDRQKIGSAIVVNLKNEVIGIFTTSDAVRILKNMIGNESKEIRNNWSIGEIFEKWEDYEFGAGAVS